MTMSVIFREALALYRRSFVTFLVIAFIAQAVPFSLGLLGSPPLASDQAATSGPELRLPERPPAGSLEDMDIEVGVKSPMDLSVGRLILITLTNLIAILLCMAALTRAVADEYSGNPLTIRSAFSDVFTRFWPFVRILLMIGLLYLGVGLMLLMPFLGWVIVPVAFLVLSIWTVFLIPVFVIEDHHGFKALDRSYELSYGNWARIFILWIVIAAIDRLTQGALAPLAASLVGDSLLALQATETFMNALFLPIPIAATVLLYFDVRVRTGGLDLERLSHELASGSSGEAASPSDP